ncbi:MAG TPA: cobalamin-dependent protein [Acidimicrobiia bacterium]|nr:cobalamin-dependent protein [Acidimicrobiia bacterium]HTC82134.1 cobalamin-dependent protein [Acidimicrobiia bacterium]
MVAASAGAVARDPRLAGRKAVVAKLGMDAHWRGVIVVAHALRDAGMEVVYLGHATSGQLVTAVVQEDPALVGLSSLSGNHLEECAAVLDGLRAADVDGVPVVVGGTIPPSDEPALAEMGVAAVFGSGTPLRTIIDRIGDLLDA